MSGHSNKRLVQAGRSTRVVHIQSGIYPALIEHSNGSAEAATGPPIPPETTPRYP